MSAQTISNRPFAHQLRVGPVGIALVAVAGILGGLGVAAGPGLLSLNQPAIRAEAPVFDAIQFRADEKSLSGGTPVFDAAQFRAGEKDLTTPVFDAAKFRADEKSLR